MNHESNGKSRLKANNSFVLRGIFFIFPILAVLLSGASLHAQIYVTNSSGGNISEYDLSTGALIDSALVSGLSDPTDIGTAENNLYVQTASSSVFGDAQQSYLAQYSLSGSLINPSFVPFPFNAGGLAISGTNLFIFGGANRVFEFDTDSGSVIHYIPFGVPAGTDSNLPNSRLAASSGSNLLIATPGTFEFFTTGCLLGPYNGEILGYNVSGGFVEGTFGLYGVGTFQGMVASDNDLFISGILTPANSPSTAIGVPAVAEYDATTGNLINPSLIAGLNDPTALALLGNDLFVLDAGNGTIGEYDATTGDPINTSLVTGLVNATDFTVVPEPGVSALFGLGLIALLSRIIPRRRRLLV